MGICKAKVANQGAFVKIFEHEGPIFEVGGRIGQFILFIALLARPVVPNYLSTKPRFLRSGHRGSPTGPGYLCLLVCLIPR